MTKHFHKRTIIKIIFSLLVFSSCTTGLKRIGNTEDEVLYNKVDQLYKKKRYIQAIHFADQFKAQFPNSSYRPQAEYEKGLVLEEQEMYGTAYGYWIDYSKLYPNFKSAEVKEKIIKNTGLLDPIRPFGFFELSLGNSIALGGDIAQTNSKKNNYTTFSYYSHMPGRFVHGIYLGFSGNHLDNIPSSTNLFIDGKRIKEINVFNRYIGYSFKAEILKDKLQSIISIAPMLSNVTFQFTDSSPSRSVDKFGLNARASLDYKIYDDIDAISKNGKYYLTFGVDNNFITRLNIAGINNSSSITSWYIGFKI